MLMLSGIIVGSSAFAMTQSTRPHVGNVAILVMDQVVMIFLAVLWFGAFDEILVAVIPPGHHWWLLLFNSVITLLIAIALAWTMRNRAFGLAAFCGAGAHFVSFMGVHFATTVQKNHFTFTPLHCVLGFAAIVLIFIMILSLLYVIKRAVFHIKVGSESPNEGTNEFMDRFDDLENDFMSVSLAAYWALCVRFIIEGTYPKTGAVDPGEKPPHSGNHRVTLLLYALASLVIGTILCGVVAKVKSSQAHSYVANRGKDIFKAFMIHSWTLGFMVWVQMSIYEHEVYSLQPVVTRILFASCVSLCAIVVVLALAGSGGGIRAVLLASAGMMVGMAWEQTFDASLDALLDGYASIHWIKGALSLGVSAFVLPSYILCYKPIALKAAKEEGK
jgi:hypothetical protein